MKSYKEMLERTLLTEEEIQRRVEELGKEITEKFKNDDTPVIIIGILRGCTLFMSDLLREIDLPLEIDYMAVSSYGDSSKSSGVVRIDKDLEEDIEGKNVLIVEDIIDTGLTLDYLDRVLKNRGAKRIYNVCLLDKEERREIDILIDFKGFTIPNEFVIGYGMDYAQKGRNLPYIAVVKRSVYE